MGVEDVMAVIRKEFEYYPEILAYLNRPPVIPGLGESGGLEMQLEARGEASWENLVKCHRYIYAICVESSRTDRRIFRPATGDSATIL